MTIEIRKWKTTRTQRLDAMRRRLSWLYARGNQRHSYILSEIEALEWAIETLSALVVCRNAKRSVQIDKTT